MQTPSASPGMPSEPLPIAQVTTGMSVVDAAGEEVGTVTDVKMSGTATPDDVPDELRARLAGEGFLRVGGSGLMAGDFYVAGPQVTGVTTTGGDGVVQLAVRKDDLHRAG